MDNSSNFLYLSRIFAPWRPSALEDGFMTNWLIRLLGETQVKSLLLLRRPGRPSPSSLNTWS
jgi:hypothetical protein